MTDTDSAILFAPPRPPVRVDGPRDVVIGRAPSCDLTVESARASRNHAAVRRDGDRYLVRDLGSTNGTFVNGDRVQEDRQLEPGDRIQVGETTVTFCRVDGAMAGAVGRPVDQRTIVMTPGSPPGQEVLLGDFDQIPAFAVLQMLELGGQTGVLSVEGTGAGRLWLEEGRPIHAEACDLDGFDAAMAILQAETGLFQFEPGEPPRARTIESTVTHLLLEASRRSDEENA